MHDENGVFSVVSLTVFINLVKLYNLWFCK